MLQPLGTILTFSQFHEGKTPTDADQYIPEEWDVWQVIEILINLNSAIESEGFKHPYLAVFCGKLSEPYQIRLAILKKLSPGPDLMLTSSVVIIKLVLILANRIRTSERQMDDRIRIHETDALFDILIARNESHYKVIGIGSSPDTVELLWELMIAQSPNAFTKTHYVRTGVAMQALFQEFLKKQLGDRYPVFNRTVSDKISIRSVTDLPLVFLSLYAAAERAAKNQYPHLIINSEDPEYKIINALGLVAMVRHGQGSLKERVLYERPFFLLKEDRLHLFSTQAFSLVTNLSWLYFLYSKKILSKFIPEITDGNSVASFYGKCFIERFLIKRTFDLIENRGIRVIASDDSFFPDMTIVINEKHVLLFEVKSSSLNANAWMDGSIDQLKEFILANFSSNDKGIVQLHKAVVRMVRDTNNRYHFRKPLRSLTIYPIIVYTEPHLNIPGVNDFVIQNAPVLDKNIEDCFKKVYPVTMISDDFFLENVGSMMKDRHFVQNPIKRYIQFKSEAKKKYRRENSTYNFTRTVESFDSFAGIKAGAYDNDAQNILKQLKPLFT